VQVNSNFYLNNISSGNGPTLKYGGAAVTVGQFDPYVPIAVEQTAGGYQVALKDTAGNQFSIWNTDSNGNFVSFAVYSGNSAALKSLEISFQQDLNGDSALGAAVVTSETIAAPQEIGSALNPGGSDLFRFSAELSQNVGSLSDPLADDHRLIVSGESYSALLDSAIARIELGPALDPFNHNNMASPAADLIDSELHHFIIR
jgi:hypothetical protein